MYEFIRFDSSDAKDSETALLTLLSKDSEGYRVVGMTEHHGSGWVIILIRKDSP